MAKTFSQRLDEARGLAAAGRIEEAAGLLMTAGEEAGEDPPKLCAAAAELVRIGRFGKAHKLCMKALSLDPERAETHLLAAEVYLESKDPERARLHLERAGGKLGETGAFHYLKGWALLHLHDPQAAIADFKKALAAGYRQLRVYQLLSHALETTNRGSEVAASAGEGLKVFPGDATLTLILAKARVREGKDTEAWALLQGLKPERMEPAVAAAYWFEAGAILDRRKDAAGAFAAFTRGNDLKRPFFERGGHRPETSLGLIEASLKLDWKKLIAAALQTDGPAPIFLVGFPRSGTTLLDQILDSHPMLRVLEEKALLLPGLQRLEDAGLRYPAFLEAARGKDLQTLRADYVASVRQE
ncbi:MAG TPA: tetratricopeptide repeat protein, partial [Sphingomonadales bacterium]|nr:tetratricopeptide repeat protein [Sphingomonadales bacterium]